MAYADFASAYISWLQSQLDYINKSGIYSNFYVNIDPSYEVQAFKNAADINQQQIFHNAADDQVGILRALKEIQKTPSDYLSEYADFLDNEIAMVQASVLSIKNTHDLQNNSDKAAIKFYSAFSPDVLTYLSTYNPMRIFD